MSKFIKIQTVFPFLALLIFAVFSNGIDGAFIFDDYPNIVQNPDIQDLSDIGAWASHDGMRPFGFFTFALNYHFSKLDSSAYHITNILIHILNSCLVFLIILQIHKILNNKNGPMLALAGAILFAVHPSMVQGVTYIIQRLAVLGTFFYYLSIFSYLKFRTKKARKWLIFLLLAFVAGIFSKEICYTIPFTLLLIELAFFRRGDLKGFITTKKIILFLAGLLFLSGFGLLVYTLPLYSKLKANGAKNPFKMAITSRSTSLFEPRAAQQGSGESISAMDYFRTQTKVHLRYFRTFLFPLNLNIDYDIPIEKQFSLSVWLSLLLLIGFVILGIRLFTTQPIISFAILFYFIANSIESSILPLPNLMYEYRMILPSLSFAILLPLALSFVKKEVVRIALFVGIVGVFALLTIQRNELYKSPENMWTDAVKKSPGKARTHGYLGTIYAKAQKEKLAEREFDAAIAINPDYSLVLKNRAFLYISQNRFDEALRDLNRSVESTPGYEGALLNRGNLHMLLKNYQLALEDFDVVIRGNKSSIRARQNRVIALARLGRFQNALDALDVLEKRFRSPDWKLRASLENQINSD